MGTGVFKISNTRRSGSVSHTASVNGWWKVTLQKISYVSYVDVYNRMDCCQERLKLAQVSLDDEFIGQIPQIDGIQKYMITVKRRGKLSMLPIFK